MEKLVGLWYNDVVRNFVFAQNRFFGAKRRKETGMEYDNSMVGVCRKLRRLGKLGRVTLDDSEHRSGLNKHLFDYIEYCGMEVLEYIKGYLSNLQPYMIERRKDQEPEKSYICVIDRLYRVSVYIKVYNKQFEEVIVSFHEDNKRGIARINNIQTYENKNRLVPVFADQENAKVPDEEKYGIKIFVQRGLMILPLELFGIKVEKDVYLVEEKIIERYLVSYCNDYIRDLYSSDLDLDYDSVEVFTVLQQLSFTSYGRDTFSSVSILIDSLGIQKDVVSRAVADSALITYVQNLQLSQGQKEELVELLKEKFTVTGIRHIDLILDRITENIALNSNLEQETELIEIDEQQNVKQNVIHNF